MKKLACIFLIVIMTILCCSCAETTNSNSSTRPQLSERFVVIDDALNDYLPEFQHSSTHVHKTTTCYVVDRYSRAVYVYVYDNGNSSGADFIPLFDKDGTILTYDGTLPE